MPAHYVETPTMVPGPARASSDPRQVFTPIDPKKTELLLHSFNIYNKWSHVITGLREGFDVGIKSAPTKTILFRKPCFITPQPRIYLLIHREQAHNWPLLPSIPTRRARSINRTISYLTNWSYPKTQFIKIPNDTRPFLPTQPCNHSFSQCRHQLR